MLLYEKQPNMRFIRGTQFYLFLFVLVEALGGGRELINQAYPGMFDIFYANGINWKIIIECFNYTYLLHKITLKGLLIF